MNTYMEVTNEHLKKNIIESLICEKFNGQMQINTIEQRYFFWNKNNKELSFLIQITHNFVLE